MSVPPGFLRVNKARPCLICRHRDWCLVSSEEPPTRAVCQRIESKHRFGEAGWLHRLRDDGWKPACSAVRSRRIIIPQTAPGLREQAERFQREVGTADLAAFARQLGVTVTSLQRLHVGWTGSAWSFPMCDAVGGVVGIRLRRPDGRKFAVRGGTEGIFLPSGISAGGVLLVAEGPTDTAALLDLGFNVIGRPSCSGGTRLIRDFVRRTRPGTVVIAADADSPGRKGAEVLSVVLATFCRDVRIIVPPSGIKDARAWVNAGATKASIDQEIAAALPLRLSVQTRKVGP